MNLSDIEIQQLIAIVDTHVELLDDRLAYFQGDINGKTFNNLLEDRQAAYHLSCTLKEHKHSSTYTIAIKMPDRFVDRN